MPEKTEALRQDASGQKRQRIYSVSELTQDIKLILENTFEHVVVEGEISGASRINTGTTFFTLKDERAQLKCVLFYNTIPKIKFRIKNGMKVIALGRIGVYERNGNYQLYVDNLEPKGIGSLQLALEQLKERLQKEGLFDASRKRPIPYLPSRVGLVTSPSGAAIKDFFKVINRRFKDIEIIIRPARVQGEGAKEDIAQAINDFNQYKQVEVIVVTRGGGSIEDLWAFNEEIVAYAIYNSRIPIISAVGHERDVTIADLVADLREPTPSAAAEALVPKKEDLRQAIEDSIARLNYNIRHALQRDFDRFSSVYKKLQLLNPILEIPHYQQRLADLSKQLIMSVKNCLRLKLAQFHKLIEKLEVLSPLAILSRGYSITFEFPKEAIIKDIKSIKVGDQIKTRLHKGEIISQIKEVK